MCHNCTAGTVVLQDKRQNPGPEIFVPPPNQTAINKQLAMLTYAAICFVKAWALKN